MPSTSPALTWSPTATLTAVTVPLAVKFSLTVVAGLMLPEAVTLSWTMPRSTVTVRAMPVDAKRSVDRSRPKPVTAAIARTRAL